MKLSKVEQSLLEGWDITVVCHTFNHEMFIGDALNSFFMQRGEFSFGVLVYDDCSKDETCEVVRKFQAKYPRNLILIEASENQFSKGVKPRSITFPLVKSKFIAFCEGDDFWTDELKLGKQLECLRAEPQLSMVYCDCDRLENGVLRKGVPGEVRRDLTAIELAASPSISTRTVMFRNVVDFPTEASNVFYGDLFLWAQLSLYGGARYLGSVAPSVYRIHDQGIHNSREPLERLEKSIWTRVVILSYFSRMGLSAKHSKQAIIRLAKELIMYLPLTVAILFITTKLIKQMRSTFF